MVDMIELDSHWNDGHYTAAHTRGLTLAGKHYFAWTVSDEYISQSDFSDIQREAQATGEWFASWDAWSLLKRYQASAKHDVSMPFDLNLEQALSRVRAKTLILPCKQDRLLSVVGAERIAQGISNAKYVAVDSPKGHLAWRASPGSSQTRFITETIRAFLGISLKERTTHLMNSESKSANNKGDG